jgi:hypothetical protein
MYKDKKKKREKQVNSQKLERLLIEFLSPLLGSLCSAVENLDRIMRSIRDGLNSRVPVQIRLA